MTKHFSSFPAAALALLAAAGLLGWYVLGRDIVSHADDVIMDREVVSYAEPIGVGDDAIIRYQYLGEALPEKLAPDEDVSKRTETSYTRDLGVENPGTRNERHRYESVFFSAPSFTQDGDSWRYIESATTTKAAFDAKRHGNPLASFFWKKAYAASVAPFSGSGDGYTVHTETGDAESPIAFTDCDGLGGLSGPAAAASGTAAIVESILSGPIATRTCEIGRGFLPFDTSAISSSATISSATLNVYVSSKTNGVNDGNDTGVLVQTTQASSGTLNDTDHVNVGATAGATSLDITSMTTSAYNTWTLNATGLSWIKKSGQASSCGTVSGYTCLGLREGHDVLGTMTVNVTGNSFVFSTAEQTGTSQDPYLSVTYTTGRFGFWMWSDY